MGARPRRPARNSRSQQLVAAFIPALIVSLSVTGFVWAQQTVTIVVDGETRIVETQASDVAGVLEHAGIAVDRDDVIAPPQDAPVTPGMTVVVRHSVPVLIELGDERIEVDVVGSSVADALTAAGLDPDASPGVTPSLESSLSAHMVISAPDAFMRVVSEQDEIAPNVEHTSDPSLPVGTTRVVSEGRPGEMLKVYRVYVVDGVESRPVLTSETVTIAPRKRVVAVGSAKKPLPRMAALAAHTGSKDKASAGSGARLRVTATAYSPQQAGLSDHTATGARARRGIVAVDPDVIPLGTRLHVPGYGWAVAADTGGAVRGRHIDVCFDTVAEARDWGRRSVTVTIAD